jgi:hypothetical protein
MINTGGVAPQISATGTLLVQGSAAAPAVFTSYYDDARGGDSDADGGARAPAVHDWDGIYLGSGAVLDHAVVSYSGSYWRSAVRVSGVAATITNSAFAHNDGGNPNDKSEEGVLDASSARAGTVIAK